MIIIYYLAASIIAALLLTKKFPKKYVYPGILIAIYTLTGNLFSGNPLSQMLLSFIACAILTGLAAIIVEFKTVKDKFLKIFSSRGGHDRTNNNQTPEFTNFGKLTFNYGHIINSTDSSYTTTHVTIGKDAFGNASASTSNTTHKTYSFWLKDRAQNIDIKFSGQGEAPGITGHEIGVASINGEPKFEMNYSTGNFFSKKASHAHPLIETTIITIGSFLLGWMAIPFFLIVKLVKPESPLFCEWRYPGSQRGETLVLSTIIIFTATEYLLLYLSALHHSGTLAILAFILLIPQLITTYIAHKKLGDAFEILKSACVIKMNEIRTTYISRPQESPES